MTQPTPPQRPHLVGFTGKIPACPDFVRQHIGDPIGTHLENWLHASAQNLYHGKLDLGPECLRFGFSAAECQSIAVGCLTRSADQVGRSYPLAIYTSLPATQAMACLAALPAAFSSFLDAAESVLSVAGTLPLEGLRDHVIELHAPSEQDCAVAQIEVHARATQLDARELLARALEGRPDGSAYYALYTLCVATGAFRTAPAASAATVLDCPLEKDFGPALWLELLAKRLSWSTRCPSFVWTSSPASRLLVAIGYASDQLLSFAANPKHSSARLWPLTTDRSEAIAQARSSLEKVLGDLSAQAAAPALSVTALADQLSLAMV